MIRRPYAQHAQKRPVWMTPWQYVVLAIIILAWLTAMVGIVIWAAS